MPFALRRTPVAAVSEFGRGETGFGPGIALAAT